MGNVITRSSLVSDGRDRGLGDRRVRSGTWTAAAPSTYLEGAATLGDRVQAALAHVGGRGVVTGTAACQLLGMPYVPASQAVPVLVSADRRLVSTPWVRVMPTTRPTRWCSVAGVRVAAPARSLIDAARAQFRLRDVRALLLGALTARRVALVELVEELDAGARGGSALTRRVLHDAARGAASAPEAELADVAVDVARAGGLPPFLLNPEVRLDGRLLGFPDGWALGLGLGWEVDSAEFHDGDDDRERTDARHDRFTAVGLQLLHATPRRLRAMGAAHGQVIADAVRARRECGYVEPDGLTVTPRGLLLPERPRVRFAV